MSGASVLLTRLDIVVAVFAVLGAVKSAYNGNVRSLVNNIKQIPDIGKKVDHIEERQEQMVDGLIAVSVAQVEEDAEIDPDTLANRLREGDSYRVYLNRSDGSGARQNYAEDPESGGRWQTRDDDD